MSPLNHLQLLACLLFLDPVGSKAQTANRFDIIIEEILADPSPSVGLPNSEFIELKNVSSTAFSLRNWKISDGLSTATINNDFILQPGAYVIICPNAAVTEYNNYGNSIGITNFPSLNNDRDILVLYSPEGKIIHAIEYSDDWYHNDIKRNGGWSLEMTDTNNPCSGINNWKASRDASGGTPGRINSVEDINHDDLPPALLRTYTIDSITIVAVFDEPLDSVSAGMISNYSIDKGMGTPISVSPVAPLFTEVILKFSSAISSGSVYELTVMNITDCAGNSIGANNKAATGLSTLPAHFDIVINEILFNPPPEGYDFIELYNRSNNIIDLQELYVCNQSITGNFTNISKISDKPILFFPGEYYVFSGNINWLQMNYMIKDTRSFIQLFAMPSMPDDKEHIAIINVQTETIDELQYDKKWHFELIDNDEGVSLERINYNDSTKNRNNWTSAASTAKFATPGFQNSQFRADLSVQGTVTAYPKIFAPDNSGIDDFTTISCRFNEPGYVVNITLFDDKGRRVRYLTRNETIRNSANFRWDGTDDRQRKLPEGQYIILTEIFNLQGKTKKFRNVVVLATKL